MPFVVEVSMAKAWGDWEVVWEGLRPDGLAKEDGEALAITGAAPWFLYSEQDAGTAVEEEPMTAQAYTRATEQGPGVVSSSGARLCPGRGM